MVGVTSHNSAHGLCFAVNVALHARPIFSLSNGLDLMSLRPSVVEQSAREPGSAGPFFAVFEFSISHVNSMEHVITC